METVLTILGSIGFDWRVALANLVNFLIVFALLNKFVLPSIRATLARRKEVIEKGLADAARADQVLASARDERDELLKEGRAKAHEILAEAQHSGNEVIKRAEEKAIAQGELMVAKAKKEIEAMQAEAMREIDRQARALVASGLERVLREKLDSAKDAELIDAMLTGVANAK